MKTNKSEKLGQIMKDLLARVRRETPRNLPRPYPGKPTRVSDEIYGTKV